MSLTLLIRSTAQGAGVLYSLQHVRVRFHPIKYYDSAIQPFETFELK